MVQNCKLHDLGYVGYPFTWTTGREGAENIQERLDRFLANDEWSNMFPVLKVTNETRFWSDHCPVMINFDNGIMEELNNKHRNFKFEEAWLREAACDDLVESAWVQNGNAMENMKNVKNLLLSSNLFSLKKSRDRVRELEGWMANIQQKEPSKENLAVQNKIRLKWMSYWR